MSEPLLRVEGLCTRFFTEGGVVHAVEDLSIEVRAGETLGIVGESGSGKSVTSLSVMGLLPDSGARVVSGSIRFLGRDLRAASAREMTDVRGSEIAMIFQEPMTSLNPVIRVGRQVAEAVVRHRAASATAARSRVIELFREVGIPEPERRIDSYPHELSGGQKQRVMIAMALACDPKLLIADEPTTALDVTIQAQILALLRELQRRRGMGLVFITHDLGVIAEIADRVAVMYRGRIVEYGDVLEVFARPRHPYTRGLLACRPRLDSPFRVLPTVEDFMGTQSQNGVPVLFERRFDPKLDARLRSGPALAKPDRTAAPLRAVANLTVRFPIGSSWGRTRWFTAVDDVSLAVWPGETLGLVGESGCGKTTLGRAILRLVEPSAGTVTFRGIALGRLGAEALRKQRRHLQIVFQDPYASLNPRVSIERALVEPMEVHGIGTSAADRRRRAASLLEEVGLAADHLARYPHEFSGGQRQRICIARALAVEPSLLVCDEAVSALDVSVQAQVLNLLKELQVRRGLAYIFISHDLAVVKFMSDRMCVMRDGRIVESGDAAAIYAAPKEDYTRALIAAIPKDGLDHIRARRLSARGPTPA
ncbi:MAG: ABC transporter ATP-binding protein [Deltaproteobacteria bacterium]|nr:ABC transporter ATP-binding protein [Deltaproteobacteria bacterium]